MAVRSDLTRRTFLGSAALAGTAALAACSSVHSGGPDTGGSSGSTQQAGAKASQKVGSGTITFAFWGGSTGETKGFTYVKDKFEAANPGAKVNFKVVPYDGFFAGIDRGITANNAPDLFRVDYTTIGKYSAKNVLLDMTPYFTNDEIKEFLPALWDAVKYNGVAYGVPHQTDTSCVVYNKQALADAGVTSVPDSLDNAWSWDEFGDVAAKLRTKLDSKKFPFAYNWTAAGAFRWLSLLYQAGGTLLTDDLKKCALPSDAGTAAMDFSKSFFSKKWVPRNNTVKTSQYSDNFFLSQVVPMTFVGDFLVPSLADPKTGYKGGDWAATFLPKKDAAAADLGGNAIVVNKATKNPDLAAAFAKFLVDEDMMKYFCEQAIELPTRQSLVNANLDYAYRPDVVKVCAQQASTISDTIVKESTVSAFADINTVLQDQLEQAFNGQSSSTTIKNIASKVNAALGA